MRQNQKLPSRHRDTVTLWCRNQPRRKAGREGPGDLLSPADLLRAMNFAGKAAWQTEREEEKELTREADEPQNKRRRLTVKQPRHSQPRTCRNPHAKEFFFFLFSTYIVNVSTDFRLYFIHGNSGRRSTTSAGHFGDCHIHPGQTLNTSAA